MRFIHQFTPFNVYNDMQIIVVLLVSMKISRTMAGNQRLKFDEKIGPEGCNCMIIVIRK